LDLFIKINIKKVIMGLIDKIQNRGNQPKVDSPALIELNKNETEFLLSLIKNTTFKGEHIELLYNLTLKLQKLYLLNKE